MGGLVRVQPEPETTRVTGPGTDRQASRADWVTGRGRPRAPSEQRGRPHHPNQRREQPGPGWCLWTRCASRLTRAAQPVFSASSLTCEHYPTDSVRLSRVGWGVWCSPCARETPGPAPLVDRHRHRHHSVRGPRRRLRPGVPGNRHRPRGVRHGHPRGEGTPGGARDRGTVTVPDPAREPRASPRGRPRLHPAAVVLDAVVVLDAGGCCDHAGTRHAIAGRDPFRHPRADPGPGAVDGAAGWQRRTYPVRHRRRECAIK